MKTPGLAHFAVLGLLFSQASAATCDTGSFLPVHVQDTRLAIIQVKTPLYNTVNKNGDTCQLPGCGSKGYLIKGDEVVVRGTSGTWACIDFTSKTGQATWSKAVPLKNLKFPAPQSSLLGTWRVEDQTLLLRTEGNKLLMRGWSQYPWSSDPDPGMQAMLKSGGVNVGNVDFTGPWKTGQTSAQFGLIDEQNGCALIVRALGPYLLAGDNGQCGGMNVSFGGLYRRVSPKVSQKDWQDAKAP